MSSGCRKGNSYKGTEYEFVGALNGNGEKRIPKRLIQRRHETLLPAARRLSGGLVLLDLPGEPLVGIDLHAVVAAIW